MFIIGILVGHVIIRNVYIVYHGPNSNIIKKQIFHDKQRNICYKLEPKVHICPSRYHNK